MQFLITGIGGHIGRRLSEMLNSRGVKHRGIDMIDYCGGIPFLKCDLTQVEDNLKLKEFLKPITHVIHMAAKMSNATDIGTHWNEQFDTNVIGTINLLNALSEKAIHISFASSMTVYGIPEQLPVDEDHPVHPENLYALGKLCTERYLQFIRKSRKIPIAILRYSSVYGPGSITHRAIPNMIEKALAGLPPIVNGSGRTARDYVYIDDVCYATIAASERLFSGVMNVGSGIGTSIAYLAEEISKIILPGKSPIYDRSKSDGYSFYYNIQKMKKELDYTPKITISEGISETIKWHRERNNN